ncbi:TIGR04255 family protein [Nodularia chucula]|uniref:TIGR04255 family protein n=1 Tax=Nodularia chucula TaxID=3093667 RepID=UPI0039C7628A
MEAKINYTKIPITEALIDLRIKTPVDGGLISLNNFGHQIQAEYTRKDEIVRLENKINIGQGATFASANQSVLGYRFLSPDDKQIVQARLDGFSFSRLAPYQKWEPFRDEAQRLWDIYQIATDSKTVSRVTVRYINRLDLPLPFNDFKEYLLTVPEISPKISQGLSDYFMQLQIPQEDVEAMLVLTEAIIPPSDNMISVLLDINLFADVDFDSNRHDHWRLLETFRIRKNEIFEGCITDKTRELLK